MLYNEVNTLKNANTREFRIYAKTNEHPRTINTYANSRTYYTIIKVYGVKELQDKINELKNTNVRISEICTGYGTRIYCF